MEGKKTAVLICGILSVVLSGCCGVGIIPAIIALVNSGAISSAEGFVSGKAKVGKILAIVGLVLCILSILGWAFYAIVVGMMAPTMTSYSSYY